MRVLDIVELFDVPVPPPNPGNINYFLKLHFRIFIEANWQNLTEFRKDLKPLQIIQPEGFHFIFFTLIKKNFQGPSFKVTGRKVEWQNWSFRVGKKF